MEEQLRPFSPPTNNEESIKKQRMTPYYNPRASPEGKGIKMFRQLRFNPITNEYIMSPMTPEKNVNNQNYNNYNNAMNMNSNYLDNSTNNNNNLNSNTGINKIDLLRNLLAKRGKKSIFIIQRMFYIYDRSQTGEIPFEKLCDIFEIYNINLTKEEIFEFFNILDKEHKGIIKYNNLIQILIDNINQNREILIQKLFERFNINGFVLINDLKQSFNPMKHPDVINQIKNKEEIFLDFIDSLEIFREYNGNLNNENIKSGYMSYEDFSNFFKEISMSILDDKYFEYFINNCFYDKNLENKNNYGYGNDNVRIRAGKQIINNV
jgi:Ca2+-binding EF-hand superfamily protein